MRQSNLYLTALLVGAGVLAYGSTVHAGVIAMPPAGPARVAGADAVVVGKVEGIEPEDVKVGTTTYRIAVVRIGEGLKGIKNEKSLRVGFIPIEKPKNPMVFVSGPRPLQLEIGQDGLFILTKQGKENFYTIGGVVGYYVNSDKNKDFDKEVQAAKSAAKMANPQASLKAKDAGERLLAASLLIEQYRTFRGPNSKEEPIDADESKLILQTLADADWTAAWNFTSLRPIPGQLFQRLGVTKADGFTPPPDGNFQTAAQTWLRDNAQKYRIRRFVAAEKK